PRVISITQATEVGTVYRPSEIQELSRFAHEHNMVLHADGARIANAAASLQLGLRELARETGIDVLSFGATKNGALGAEAVVFLNPECAANFKFYRKQGMQLASKMRFVAAQFEALLSGNLWLQNARHANAMAQLLKRELRKTPEGKFFYGGGANGFFA